MKTAVKGILAAALLTTLALANSATAATILTYGQTSATNILTESTVGGVSTLTESPVPLPISITNVGGLTPPGGSLAAFETLSLTSSTGVGGPYSGTISVFLQTGPIVTEILTGTISGGLLQPIPTTNGDATAFTSNSVKYTFDPAGPGGAIIAQLGGLTSASGSLSISMTNASITPTGFTAQSSAYSPPLSPSPPA